MRTMVLLLFCFLSASFQPALAQDSDSSSTPDLSDAFFLAEAWLQAEADFKGLPGVSAAIVRGQETVWASGFGHADVENGVPMTPQTRFYIGSISKTFAAVALMTLVDDGLLRLDDIVGDVVPWFDPAPYEGIGGPITIRSLLTHSSGLSRELAARYWRDLASTPTGSDMWAELTRVPQLYPAGDRYQYSNLAYLLVGEIVSEVSGSPYVDYLEQRVLRPLGLEATVAAFPESEYGVSQAVRYGFPTRDRAYPRLDYTSAERIASMGGLSSSVLDLGRYASWQLRLHGDDARDEVLHPSTLRAMHRVHFTDRDWEETRGLGFAVFQGPGGATVVGHGGHLPGHVSSFVLHPEDAMASVVMVNTSGADTYTYASGLLALVAKLDGAAEHEQGLAREVLLEYSGRYDYVESFGEVFVAPWKGRLALVEFPTDDPAAAMSVYEHLDGDVFRRVLEDGGYGEELIFVRGPDGRVLGGSYFSYDFRR